MGLRSYSHKLSTFAQFVHDGVAPQHFVTVSAGGQPRVQRCDHDTFCLRCLQRRQATAVRALFLTPVGLVGLSPSISANDHQRVSPGHHGIRHSYMSAVGSSLLDSLCGLCLPPKAGRRKIRTHGFPSDGQVDRLPKLAMTAKIPPYLSLRTSLYLGYQRKKRSGAHRSAMSSCQKLQWRRKAMQQQYYVDSMSHITDREQANRQIEIVRFLRTICLLGKHPIPARSHRRQDLVKSSRLRPLQYVPPA